MRSRMDPNKRTCILLLIKYPEEGNVKSRLAKHICEKIVVEIYRNFVLDLLSTLNKLNIPFKILFYPMDAFKKFESWLGTTYEYLPQIGDDLRERLKNGFMNVFAEDFRNVIALASDIPDISQNILNEACEALENSDVVIGPSPDGGYYLIGFKRTTFFPEIFEKIEFSKNTVYKATIETLNKVKRKIHILPPWSDIDTLEDLIAFLKNNDKKKDNSSKTLRYILRHKEILKGRDQVNGL